MSLNSFLTNDRSFEAKTPWGPVGALSMSVGFLLFQAIAALFFGLLFVFSKFGIERLRDGLSSGELALLVDPIIISLALSYVFTFGFILLIGKSRGGNLRDVLLIRKPQNLIANVIFGIVVISTFFVLLSYVIQTYFPQDNASSAKQMKELFGHILNTDYLWLGVAIVVIGAPFVEEVMFRGFLLTSFAQTRLGFWGASVVTSGLWALIHGYASSMAIGLFIFGLLLSLLVRRTGSIWVSVIMHALWNGVVTAALLASLTGAVQT